MSEVPNDKNRGRMLVQGEFHLAEKRSIEQYFYSEKVLDSLVNSLRYYDNIVCLCTPALAHAFSKRAGKTVTCLDIDERFSYLPGYIHYNITKPTKIDIIPDVIVIDPPFFGVDLKVILDCINTLTDKNYTTHLVFSYPIRKEKSLLAIFKDYNLRLTRFKLEYQAVKSSKWENYGVYSNKETNKLKF